MFAQLVANGLVTGSVIAIAAVGVSIVYAILRLVNFAYGDFMAFGALAAYAFNGPLKLGLVVSVVLAMLVTAALSLALDAVLWRPLRRRRAGFMSLSSRRSAWRSSFGRASYSPTVRNRRRIASTRTRCTCSVASAYRRRRGSRF